MGWADGSHPLLGGVLAGEPQVRAERTTSRFVLEGSGSPTAPRACKASAWPLSRFPGPAAGLNFETAVGTMEGKKMKIKKCNSIKFARGSELHGRNVSAHPFLPQ